MSEIAVHLAHQIIDMLRDSGIKVGGVAALKVQGEMIYFLSEVPPISEINPQTLGRIEFGPLGIPILVMKEAADESE